MSSTDKDSNKVVLSRRGFLKAGGVAVGTVVLGGVAGCGKDDTKIVTVNPTNSSCSGSDELPGRSYTFQSDKYGTDAPVSFVSGTIPSSSITKTYSCDVVVVGAGQFGGCAAASALDQGANVIMIEKMSSGRAAGVDFAVVNAPVQTAAGITLNVDDLVHELNAISSYRSRPELHMMWATKSAEALAWYEGVVQSKGYVGATTTTATKHGWGQLEFPTNLNFSLGAGDRIAALATYITNKGGTILYNTPACQLIRTSSTGPVTGVIAKASGGNYIQINATSVILATGGYEANTARMMKYITHGDMAFYSSGAIGENAGDGHEMGLAVGAYEQDSQHALLIDPGGILGTEAIVGFPPMLLFLMGTPLMRVSVNGRRFTNEDLPVSGISALNATLPKFCHWVVFDSNLASTLNQIGSGSTYSTYTANIAGLLSAGDAVQANDLGELAQKMNVDVDAFTDEVTRYNGFVAAGSDDDFHLNPAYLAAIATPPFTAVRNGTNMLCSVCGLMVNRYSQVIQPDGNIISGLYAGGNCAGGFYTTSYPHSVPGHSLGRCMTFGYLAGMHATNGTITRIAKTTRNT
jgi:2-polyprenyl-6-methoxyphenol hydroxylase-like FAD-dependent oxidoreductase